MKILIINSDSPNNRGDRPILAGNIKLIRENFPDAQIWSQSEHAARDSKWYGINFLPISAYTINPLHLLKLIRFARKCDYIFWGGGEILKDYTNKIGVFYWALKMSCVWLVNKNIYGAFQGIGPTESKISKKLIVYCVNRTKAFIVRDKESKEKLLRWGVKSPMVNSFDPAVLLEAAPLSKDVTKKLKEDYDISERYLDNAIGIGIRKWFHYKKSSWIPFKFKKQSSYNPNLEAYCKNLAALCDWMVDTYGVNLLFFPMHMAGSENDGAFSRDIAKLMKRGNQTRVIDHDNLSPQEYLNLIGHCRAFVGSRLHSTILSTSASVPSITFYYVDKGRLYFEQIKMQEFSRPIEDLLDSSLLDEHKRLISQLWQDSTKIKKHLHKQVDKMRKDIKVTFAESLRK